MKCFWKIEKTTQLKRMLYLGIIDTLKYHRLLTSLNKTKCIDRYSFRI